MSFDADSMQEDVGLGFAEICRVLAGLTGPETDGLMCSLPSELTFNDLRDSGRRHSRAEKTSVHNIHAVAHKSCVNRPAGGASLDLSPHDWLTPLQHKQIKTRVHSSSKATDIELGVSSEGLTKHKTSKHYSKPHIVAKRMDLLKVLLEIYEVHILGELHEREDRIELVQQVYKNMWTSRLVPEHCFVSWRQGKDQGTRFLVLGSGPYSVRILQLHDCGDSVFTFKSTNLDPTQTWVGEMGDVLVSTTAACIVDEQLAWRQSSEWMSLPTFVASHSLLQLPRSLLSSICSALGLKHGKLDYRSRVQLFLQHMGKDEQFINNMLDEIPENEPRPSRAPNEDRVCLQN